MGYLRYPGESDIDFAKRRAYEMGHMWGPLNKDGPNVQQTDLATLTITDSPVVEAFRGIQRMMVRNYAVEFALRYGTTPAFDGRFDAALLAVLETPRCDVPDYAPPPGLHFTFADKAVQAVALEMQRCAALPAVGPRGNWPRCHGVGEYHCCIVQVDMTNRPAWATDQVMTPVWKNQQTADAAIGKWTIYVDKNMNDLLVPGKNWAGHHVDVKASWVRQSSGWIGLAILTLGLGCGEEIWQQYLATYTGGSTIEQIINQQSTLWRHEDGHNEGLGHSNGWTMNPSIVNNLPVIWSPQDPSTSILQGHYGGKPTSGPGGSPPPGPGPGPNPPPLTTEQRLKLLEDKQFEDNITNTVQDVRDQLLQDKYRLLEARVAQLEAKKP